MLRFCVFSYNRGEFLRHCVRTIALCAPGVPIMIYDDLSTDATTRTILEELGRHHDILLPPDGNTGSPRKHGRLYHNMQDCFDRQPPDTLLCFLQDDMQLTRPVDPEEVTAWAALLQEPASPRFLHPAYLKGALRRQAPDIRTTDDGAGYTVTREGRSAGGWYSDILIASVDRLREHGWHFADSEAANERQASEKFAPMLYLKNPFAAWLPNAPAWRGRRQTLALRLAQRIGGAGFHPFTLLDADESRHFCARPIGELPFAEDCLRLEGIALPEPWTYHPLQGRRVLKVLNSVELKLRRR